MLARPGGPGGGLGEPRRGGERQGHAGSRGPEPPSKHVLGVGSQDPPSTRTSHRSTDNDNNVSEVDGMVWGTAR